MEVKPMTQPIKKFSVGTCSASIFVNTVTKDGRSFDLPKVSFQKRYKTKEGQWETNYSLDLNEIPKAILALQKAYEWLHSEEARDPLQGSSVGEEMIQAGDVK